MEHISQKISCLGNLRNYQVFRPVYDSNGVTPLLTLYRVRSSKGFVECCEVGSPWFQFSLPPTLLVRRVIEDK